MMSIYDKEDKIKESAKKNKGLKSKYTRISENLSPIMTLKKDEILGIGRFFFL